MFQTKWLKSSLTDLICHLDNVKLLPKISLQSRAFISVLFHMQVFKVHFAEEFMEPSFLLSWPIVSHARPQQMLFYLEGHIEFKLLPFSLWNFLLFTMFFLPRITRILSFLSSLLPHIHPSIQLLNIPTRINCYSDAICHKNDVIYFHSRII